MRAGIVTLVASIALAFAGLLGAAVRAQPDAEPTARAIQTRIADLELRLTAIAEQAGQPGTPESARTVRYKGFTLTFAEYQRLPSLWGDLQARGVFVLVFFTAIHHGPERARVPTADFHLVDADGAAYTIDDYAMFALGLAYPTGSLASGMEYHTAVVFDVWLYAADLRLVIEPVGFSLALDALELRPPYKPTPTPSGAL